MLFASEASANAVKWKSSSRGPFRDSRWRVLYRTLAHTSPFIRIPSALFRMMQRWVLSIALKTSVDLMYFFFTFKDMSAMWVPVWNSLRVSPYLSTYFFLASAFRHTFENISTALILLIQDWESLRYLVYDLQDLLILWALLSAVGHIPVYGGLVSLIAKVLEDFPHVHCDFGKGDSYSTSKDVLIMEIPVWNGCRTGTWKELKEEKRSSKSIINCFVRDV